MDYNSMWRLLPVATTERTTTNNHKQTTPIKIEPSRFFCWTVELLKSGVWQFCYKISYIFFIEDGRINRLKIVFIQKYEKKITSIFFNVKVFFIGIFLSCSCSPSLRRQRPPAEIAARWSTELPKKSDIYWAFQGIRVCCFGLGPRAFIEDSCDL